MATPPSNPEAPKPERIAYAEEDKLGPLGIAEQSKLGPLGIAEEDKLGPLGIRASALHDPIGLRAELLAEFERAVAAAKTAAARVDQSSTAAVHESRKALRRARAALAMMAGALPKGERRAVRGALQSARRSLSTVRDHAVAPLTLGSMTLSDRDRETAKRVLDNAAEALPALAEIKQLLGEAAARAAAQAEALAAALPPEISWDTVRAGIEDVYREARRAHQRAKRSRPRFHTWRRRSKELVYQLDFVAAHAGARTLELRADIDAIADQLGPVVDLVMLRDFVQTHAQGLPESDVEELRHRIDRQLAEQMVATRKAGRDAFKRKPKQLVRRLAKAVKRDLRPAGGVLDGAEGQGGATGDGRAQRDDDDDADD
ncbi:MAG TPA: CHAD domain-containing protein [Kofleriaceae bacterium]|nr:CHAD domain-containing protein [Kofleriaceae bacterium]